MRLRVALLALLAVPLLSAFVACGADDDGPPYRSVERWVCCGDGTASSSCSCYGLSRGDDAACSDEVPSCQTSCCVVRRDDEDGWMCECFADGEVCPAADEKSTFKVGDCPPE